MNSIVLNSKRNSRYVMHTPAVSAKWNHIDFLDVARLEFVTRLSFRAFLWILIFISLSLNLYLKSNELNTLLVILASGILTAGSLLLLVTFRQHYLLFYMKDGSKTKIAVPKENINYVRRFVSIAKRRYNK